MTPTKVKMFMACLAINQTSREVTNFTTAHERFKQAHATMEEINTPGSPVRIIVTFPDGHQIKLGRRHGTTTRKYWWKEPGDPFINLESHSKIESRVPGWAVDPQQVDGYIFSWDSEITDKEYLFWTWEILEAFHEFWPMFRKHPIRDTTQWTPASKGKRSHHSRSIMVSISEMHEMLTLLNRQRRKQKAS